MTVVPPELVDDFDYIDPDTGWREPCSCGPLHDWMLAHGVVQADGTFTDAAASIFTGSVLGICLCVVVWVASFCFRQSQGKA